MFSTDEGDDDAAMGAVRYSIMPSLVALQQMRNRLHLAYLGRKLMKMTALATGKELRRISFEIAAAFENYAEEMTTAYMLLARARYYLPKVNDVVVENIATSASASVGISVRSISGVKISKFQLVESGGEPYPLLGIEKGGMAISDAKHAWLKLLRLMINILQLRVTFRAVEIAHKNATKKQNVLSRVIIPKIVVTMRYIMSELDEQEREETFRLKRFKELKNKKKPKENVIDDYPIEEAPPKVKPMPKIQKVEPVPKLIEEKVKKAEPIPEFKEEPVVFEKVKEKEIRPKEEFIEEKVDKIIRHPEMIDTLTHTNICSCCLSLYAVGSETENQCVCALCLLEAETRDDNPDLPQKFVPCLGAYLKAEPASESHEHLKTKVKEIADSEDQYKVCGDAKREADTVIPIETASKVILSLRPTPAESTHPSSLEISHAPSETNIYKLTSVPKPKLGYFEKIHKEIVKVTRLRNKDGSVSEKKHVITIKTETRMPKTEEQMQDINFGNQQSYIGACTTNSNIFGGSCTYGGCGGPEAYSTPGGTDKMNKYTRNSPRFSGCMTENGDYPNLKSGQRHTYPPVTSMSEASCRKDVMEELKIRCCVSASYQDKNSTNVSITSDDICVCFELSKLQKPLDCLQLCSSKADKTTSMDSKICCQDCSKFICSTELATGSQNLMTSKYVSESTSIESCCCFYYDTKSTADKTTSMICSYKTIENECINTVPSQKEVSCSSTHSKCVQISKSRPKGSCNMSVCSKNKNTNKGYSIKILSRPPKVCDLEREDTNSEVVLKGSVLNALRQIVLPTKSTQCSETTVNQCPYCQSKIESSSSPKCLGKSNLNPTCFMCQMKIEVEREEEFVKEFREYSGSLDDESSTCESVSTKSAAAGSSYITTSSSTVHVDSKSKKCSAETFEHKPTYSYLAHSVRSISINCPSHNSSKLCFLKRRTLPKFDGESKRNMKDAMTSTKRSDKYDCRPLKGFRRVHPCGKIMSAYFPRNSESNILSHVLGQKSQHPLLRSSSCRDDFFSC